jgi:hypothetical protein
MTDLVLCKFNSLYTNLCTAFLTIWSDEKRPLYRELQMSTTNLLRSNGGLVTKNLGCEPIVAVHMVTFD